MWDLIVSVPDHCLSFYFTFHSFEARIFTPEKINQDLYSFKGRHCKRPIFVYLYHSCLTRLLDSLIVDNSSYGNGTWCYCTSYTYIRSMHALVLIFCPCATVFCQISFLTSKIFKGIKEVAEEQTRRMHFAQILKDLPGKLYLKLTKMECCFFHLRPR